ncbi:MAG: ABC transporter permease, partial [Planctomycetia bacterium]|nr:ABC transporter permease [Planctomycetia bacterium]
MTESPQHLASNDPLAVDVSRYAALLDEAKSIKGASLWMDARQRLRQNRMAMAALYYLIGI